MGKLKGINWKQLLVDHFEKVVFVLIILCGLGAVATTRWSPYDKKHPNEVVESVTKAERQHESLTVEDWKKAEQEKYANAVDVSAKAAQLREALAMNEYKFSATQPDMFTQVVEFQHPIDEIDWLPVEQMVADAGRVLIRKQPPPGSLMGPNGLAEVGEGTSTATDKKGKEEEKEDPRDNPYARRAGGGFGMGLAGGMGPMGPGMGPGGGPGMGPGMGPGGGHSAGGGGRGGGAPGAPGAFGPGSGPGGAGPIPGMPGPGGKGVPRQPIPAEGKRYVSVRGVFPLKRQQEILAEALSLRSVAAAARQLVFRDYEIQRQAALPGPKPWSGPWEPVDISIAQDVLRESTGMESVIFDPSVMSGVFTMPLPGRLMGYWRPEVVSHPALTDFQKTDLAAKQEQFLENAIVTYKARMKEVKDSSGGGGWQNFQTGIKGIGQSMMGDAGFMRTVQGGFNKLAGGQRMSRNDLKSQIKQLINASGAYLLFRYIDFDVQPGHAYRYRVRLKVHNPAYGSDLTQVKRADIAEGRTRWTEWSKPTPVAIVPRDTVHFLATLNSAQGRQRRRAGFQVYQWTEERGTMVHGDFDVLPGTAIGHQSDVMVYDVSKQTAKTESVGFHSGDVLLDIDDGLTVAGRTNMGGTTYYVPARVLYVDQWGGLQLGGNAIGDKQKDQEKFAKNYEQFTDEYDFLREDEDDKKPGPPGAAGEGGPGIPGGGGGFGPGMRGRGR